MTRSERAVVLVCALAVASCGRAGFMATDAEPLDGGAVPARDAGSDPMRDAGPPLSFDAAVPPMDAGRDASRVDAGSVVTPDAGTDAFVAPDAGTDAFLAVDAGEDAGGGLVGGDDCSDAIDVDLGGHFIGTTCGASDTMAAPCNAPGTPDRVFWVHGVARLAAYNFILNPGYVFYFLRTPPGACEFNGGGCLESSSVLASSPAYFAVERSGGGCGTFDLEVVPPP